MHRPQTTFRTIFISVLILHVLAAVWLLSRPFLSASSTNAQLSPDLFLRLDAAPPPEALDPAESRELDKRIRENPHLPSLATVTPGEDPPSRLALPPASRTLKPSAEQETLPEPDPEPPPAPELEPEPDLKPEPPPEPEPDPAPKPEPPKPKPEPKPETKPEPKPKPKPEPPKTAPKPDTTPKPEPKPKVEPDPRPAPKPRVAEESPPKALPVPGETPPKPVAVDEPAAPRAVPATGGTSETLSSGPSREALQAYSRHVQETFENAWRPPSELSSAPPARIEVTIRRDGTVTGVRLVESSGNSLMDEAALNSARSVQKVDPFPPGLGTDVYRPKIKFQLE